ncbi:hypothetical protein LuPra_02728 [Luteitalea pratensis]|uniref:Uncharacterized protein n=1 Tax=Luteitalea pratensis TaxID=1855912 RepID=A0A143PLZ3_LUTPR|nr:hypothetical protein LuPra_02728 [Luteitalea pratensis]
MTPCGDATVDDPAWPSIWSGAAAGDVASVTGDEASDTVAFYEAARACDARVVGRWCMAMDRQVWVLGAAGMSAAHGGMIVR